MTKKSSSIKNRKFRPSSHTLPSVSITKLEPNKKKKNSSFEVLPMACGEHDRPDPSLIVEGTRRLHPSKCMQGNDYPITPLEELHVRSKGTYSPESPSVCIF